MKLDVRITKAKDMRGRIMSVKASFGNWEAEGKTPAEAEAALLALMGRMANEDADPLVRIDPNDGHVWLAYRTGHGDWTYSHCRRGDGPIGAAHMSGWTFSRDMTDRKTTVNAMDRHLVSLMPAPGSDVRTVR